VPDLKFVLTFPIFLPETALVVLIFPIEILTVRIFLPEIALAVLVFPTEILTVRIFFPETALAVLVCLPGLVLTVLILLAET
jgi:hypothetical protein